MSTPETPIRFPPPLRPKGTVGLVSPGRWPEPETIEKTRFFFEERGYHVVVHAQNYLKEGTLAGEDAARVEAIMDMFADSTIDAILCMRGGTGSLRLLDKLDYEVIAQNPKPFIGYSDMTALLHALSQRCGFVTYHGPMGVNFARADNDPRTGSDLISIAGNRRKLCRMHFPDVEIVHHGKAEGLLTGGNITLLQHLIGTPFDWSSQDAVLFIEDVDEPLYKIDRALCHLKLAGKLQGVKAVLVGEMTKITTHGPEPGADIPAEWEDVRDVMVQHLPADVPMAFKVPCGHGAYMTTLPLGARVQLTLGPRGAEIVYSPHSEEIRP